MTATIPTLVQYQGSKRKLAPAILAYMPSHVSTLVEPFCGMASLTFAAAQQKRADFYWLNDLNKDVAGVLDAAINQPDELAAGYEQIWNEQFSGDGDHVAHFFTVRDSFNAGDKTPAVFLYLLARCVKGAVRYGPNGMNQSPDKRRHGTKPTLMRQNILTVSGLLKGRSKVTSLDYKEIFSQVSSDDFLYMDPPYQGTSGKKDARYIAGVSVDELEQQLMTLDSKHVSYLLSYDGTCGDKTYGRDLSSELGCHKVLLDAGRSTQATLLGRTDRTLEALYVSDGLHVNCEQGELNL